MVEGDIFREVEEDMRREQYARAWNKYGLYVFIAAFAIIAGVAGYQAWQWWQLKQASENGEAFIRAVNLGQDGKKDEMTAEFGKLVSADPRGYGVIAKLRIAQGEASAGKTDEAAANYNSVAQDAFADPFLRDFARIQWASIQVDKLPDADIRNQLVSLTTPGNSWRHSARELIGLASFKAGKMIEAEQYFQDIASDAEAPSELRRRAQTLLALIPKPSAPPQAADNKEPARNEAKTQ
ncbi:MAG: tetratricopeptide repeat protein [Hyphomicrobiales bacterium]|nr:tetratricopeptide repeat protein [Hyphomicrobiales bacterium]